MRLGSESSVSRTDSHWASTRPRRRTVLICRSLSSAAMSTPSASATVSQEVVQGLGPATRFSKVDRCPPHFEAHAPLGQESAFRNRMVASTGVFIEAPVSASATSLPPRPRLFLPPAIDDRGWKIGCAYNGCGLPGQAYHRHTHPNANATCHPMPYCFSFVPGKALLQRWKAGAILMCCYSLL